jgi:hypothetical protein
MVATRFLALKKVGNRENLVKFVREQQVLASKMLQVMDFSRLDFTYSVDIVVTLQHGFKIVQYEKALKRSKEEQDQHRILQREARYPSFLSVTYFQAQFDNSDHNQASPTCSLAWDGIESITHIRIQNGVQLLSNRRNLLQEVSEYLTLASSSI